MPVIISVARMYSFVPNLSLAGWLALSSPPEILLLNGRGVSTGGVALLSRFYTYLGEDSGLRTTFFLE